MKLIIFISINEWKYFTIFKPNMWFMSMCAVIFVVMLDVLKNSSCGKIMLGI